MEDKNFFKALFKQKYLDKKSKTKKEKKPNLLIIALKSKKKK